MTGGWRSSRSSRYDGSCRSTELQAEDYREPPSHYFGVPATGAKSAEALERLVKQALDARGPTVIEAVIDSEHYVDTVYD
jgi:thiamine pyrophosphate-dependent acetolactate synthase large subunit-like protein